ncbi:MAG: metal ABC transporter ATP-binding protein [Pseudomonadota bacterium]
MLDRSQPLVMLDNAGVYRAGRWLVRGVSMAVQPGEIVTLIGPNGSGKTTTSKIALGILDPDEGSAALRGEVRLGYVPQKLTIDWTLPLTVRRLMHLTGKAHDDQIRQAMDQTGVRHLADAQVRTLSGGEFQRVLLARAIVRKPDLLVLDEPVQGVDFNGEIAMYELIRQIRDDYNCGVILVSHNLHLVMSATDRVICLNGHVCCSGTPLTVTASAEFKALFGERAASALAAYEHNHNHTHLPDGRVQYHDGTVSDDIHSHDCTGGPREASRNAR